MGGGGVAGGGAKTSFTHAKPIPYLLIHLQTENRRTAHLQ